MNLLKTLATLALLAVGSAVTAQSYEANADAIPFAEEPEMAGADADMTFVDEPGYTDANATQALSFEDLTDRKLAVVAGAVVAFQIAAAAAPIIADIIKGTRKECQQLACWISTDSRTCGLSVAEKVQAEITMGRDRFRYESIQPNGMWVRFWRTKFEPVDRGDIMTGTCTNNVKFAVTNCQSTGKVHC